MDKIDEEKFTAPVFINEDSKIHTSLLRPSSLKEYIGQKVVTNNIELMIESAKLRKQALDHLLFFGPPGLGKTSLAFLVAENLGVKLHMVTGPAIDRKSDLASLLANLSPLDVLFIDEIHRLHPSLEEMLYSVMEDFRLDIIIGQGSLAKTMQIKLPEFTLIGATTRSGSLSGPLRDRFLAHLHFDFYNLDELEEIIQINSNKLGLTILQEAKREIAARSRGTPRIANRILRRVRDFVFVHNMKEITASNVHKALKLLEIDNCGLESMDRKILEIIHDYYKGGPVGIDAISAALGEDKDTIQDVYEPFLLKKGFILRTSRGRKISEEGVKYLSQSRR